MRAIEHLAAVAVEAEMMPLRSAVIVPFVSTAFDEHGAPTNSAIEAAASIMLDDLEWCGCCPAEGPAGKAAPADHIPDTSSGKGSLTISRLRRFLVGVGCVGVGCGVVGVGCCSGVVV